MTTLYYKIEFHIESENDEEDKADLDESIHEALRRLGATIVKQEITEE